jgi:hypothetical protein
MASGTRSAATGAKVGAAAGSFLPGIGTGAGLAIGAGAGFLASKFGDWFGGKKRDVDPMKEQRSRLLADVMRRLRETDRPASQTDQYRTGAAEAREQVGRQATADTQAAVARGLEGGEFEIAQGYNRQRTLATTLRGLLADAEAQQSAEQGQLIGQAAQLTGQGTQAGLASERIRADRRSRRNSALFSAGTQIATALI